MENRTLLSSWNYGMLVSVPFACKNESLQCKQVDFYGGCTNVPYLNFHKLTLFCTAAILEISSGWAMQYSMCDFSLGLCEACKHTVWHALADKVLNWIRITYCGQQLMGKANTLEGHSSPKSPV